MRSAEASPRPCTPPVLQIGMTLSHAFRSGTDRYFVGLLRGLQASDGSVRAIAIADEGAGAGLTAFRPFARSGAGRFARWRGLRDAVTAARGGVDLVAAHGVAHAFPVLDRLGPLPLVVHYHGPWSREADDERLGRATVVLRALQERAVLARAARCIVLSKAYARLLEDDFGVPADRIHVIPGGIDLAEFTSDLSPAAARLALGVPPGGPVIGCASRLRRGKGIFDLIAAFALVRARLPAVRLLLAGSGPDREAVLRQIDAFGLNGAVTLLGHVDEAMPAFYRALDLCVMPTPYLEGFGLVAIESLALGTPVLVTPVGGLREAVSGLGPVALFEGIGPAELARGMLEALEGRRVFPAPEALRSFVERYAWQRVLPRVVAVYRDAASYG